MITVTSVRSDNDDFVSLDLTVPMDPQSENQSSIQGTSSFGMEYASNPSALVESAVFRSSSTDSQLESFSSFIPDFVEFQRRIEKNEVENAILESLCNASGSPHFEPSRVRLQGHSGMDGNKSSTSVVTNWCEDQDEFNYLQTRSKTESGLSLSLDDDSSGSSGYKSQDANHPHSDELSEVPEVALANVTKTLQRGPHTNEFPRYQWRKYGRKYNLKEMAYCSYFRCVGEKDCIARKLVYHVHNKLGAHTEIQNVEYVNDHCHEPPLFIPKRGRKKKSLLSIVANHGRSDNCDSTFNLGLASQRPLAHGGDQETLESLLGHIQLGPADPANVNCSYMEDFGQHGSSTICERKEGATKEEPGSEFNQEFGPQSLPGKVGMNERRKAYTEEGEFQDEVLLAPKETGYLRSVFQASKFQLGQSPTTGLIKNFQQLYASRSAREKN